MTLDKELEDFISLHIKDIDNNDFGECYRDLWWNVSCGDMAPEDIGDFTKAMQEADINILDYLNYIPECCYYKTDFTGHYLPDHIQRIGRLAFACSDIEEINCGKGLTRIEIGAFKKCAGLTTVILYPHPMLVIEGKAFDGCFDLIEIDFRGTKAEWYKTQKYDKWAYNSGLKHVNCTDGRIQIKKGIKL